MSNIVLSDEQTAKLVASLSVVTIQTTCANFDCTTQLGDFELAKIGLVKHGNKVSNNRKSPVKKRLCKQNFCILCRRKLQQIDYVNCQFCGSRMEFSEFRKWCSGCKKERYKH